MSSATAPFKIFLSCSSRDLDQGQHVYTLLKNHGFNVFWLYRDARLGSPLGTHLDFLRNADVVLVGLSRKSLGSSGLSEEVALAFELGKTIIPIVFDPGVLSEALPWPLKELRNIQGAGFGSPEQERLLISGLEQISRGRSIAQRALPPGEAPLKVLRVELENVRCFSHFDFKIGSENPLVIFAGENASGKSTLFRAIALGLCRESESAALLKESPGRMIRRGSTEASIAIELEQPGSGQVQRIVTKLLAGAAGEEIVRKETLPDPFPWEKLFACAYGTGRAQPATASHDSYALYPAVRPLFNSEMSLQNPELVLLRQEPKMRAELEERLLQILMLEKPGNRLIWNGGGPKIHGPWGDESLAALSDGYRSTTQWLLDFLSWAIQAGRLEDPAGIGGILMIDEIEQHLHPRWQRHIMQRLSQQLPGTQIFATTHSPLVVSSTADIPRAQVFTLQLGEDGDALASEVSPESFSGQRADQILASEAFGLPSSRNLGTDAALAELAQPSRERTVEKGLATPQSLRVGTTPFEQKVESALEQTLLSLALPGEEGALSEEGKKQLRSLFGKSSS